MKRLMSFLVAAVMLFGSFSALAVSAAEPFLHYPDNNEYWMAYYDAELDMTVLATGHVEDPEQYNGVALYFGGLPEGVQSVPVENIKCYRREGNAWVALTDHAIPGDEAVRRVIAGNVNVYDSTGSLYRSACTYDAFVEEQRQIAAGSDLKYRELVGVYKGKYSAPQGMTGVTLAICNTEALLADSTMLAEIAEVATRCGLNSSGAPTQSFTAGQIAELVRSRHSGDYVAFFNFYPTAANLDVEEGLYIMSVDYNAVADSFRMVGEAWICHETYQMAHLEGLRLGDGVVHADVYGEYPDGPEKVGELQALSAADMTWTEDQADAEVGFADRLFADSALYYNHDLAALTLRLEMASFTADADKNWGEGKEYNSTAVSPAYNDLVRERCAELIKAYNAMEFDTQHYYNYDVRLDDASDKVAFSIATKKDVCGATLVAVVIRGGGYGGEWSSNFNVDDGALYHTGFRTAALGVYNQVVKEIAAIEGDLKLWVTGFSRGAAVANLLAAELNDYGRETERFTNEEVYAYTFATPQGVTEEKDAGDPYYHNIFNIVNPGDIVPMVAPADWGYTRYGVTRTFTATTYDRGIINVSVFTAVNAYYLALTGETVNSRKNLAQQAVNEAVMDILCHALPTPKEAEPFLSFLQELMDLNNIREKNLLGSWKGIGIDEQHEVLRQRYGANIHWQARVRAIEFWDVMEDGPVKQALKGNDTLELLLTLAELHGVGGQQVLDLLDSLAFAFGGWSKLLGSDVELYHIFNFLEGHDPNLYLAWMLQPEYQAFGQGYVPPTLAVSVACPVNVAIYDGDLVVALVVDHKLVSSQIPAVPKGETVTFYFSAVDEADYRIEITSTDSGSMNYTVTELDAAGGVLRRTNYLDVPLEQGRRFTADVDALSAFEDGKYDLTYTDGEGTHVISATAVIEGGEELLLDVRVSGAGSVFGAGTHQRGDTVILTAYPVGNGRFAGWYCEGELLSAETQYALTLNDPMVLTAEFEAGEGYLVALVANDGTDKAEALATDAVGNVTLPACPFAAPAGMQFKGWAMSADGEPLEGETVTVAGDIVLYALWQEAPQSTPDETPDETPDDAPEAEAPDNVPDSEAPAADADEESGMKVSLIVILLSVGGALAAAAAVAWVILKRRR